MNLSEKLNVLMKAHDIKNPKELSKELEKNNLKIPYTTLLTIFNDDIQDIKLGTAKKLCTFFNISLDELLDNNIDLKTNIQMALNLEGLTDIDIRELKQIIEIKKKNNKGEI